MIRTSLTIFVHLASFASILGLYLAIYPIGSARPEWHFVVGTIIGLIFAALSVWEIVDYA